MDMEKKNRRDMINHLEAGGYRKLTSVSVRQVKAHEVEIVLPTGAVEQLPCDAVVLAAGLKPNQDLYRECCNDVQDIRMIGDAFAVRGFREAFLEAAMLVR
jgi:NADH dehydrogenase FAD-containing subunit